MKALSVCLFVMITWGALAHSKVLPNGETVFNCKPMNSDVQLDIVVKSKAIVDEIADAEITISDKTGVFPMPVNIYQAILKIETSFIYENYNYDILHADEKIGEFKIAMKNREFCGRMSCVIPIDSFNHQAMLKIYEKEIPFNCK